MNPTTTPWMRPGPDGFTVSALTEYFVPASVLRDIDDKRPHVPLVKWDGAEWVVSVIDPYGRTRARSYHSWTEALGHAHTWASINRGAGLL